MNTVDREQEKNRINKLIEECCLGLLDEVFFDSKLKELADALREHFDSDYCAIGKVDGEFLEDRVVSKSVSPKLENQNKFQERNLRDVRRVKIDSNKNCCVSRGLESIESVVFFDEEEIEKADNYSTYKKIFGEIRNTYIIPIRNRNNENIGFIQFINSNREIDFAEIELFYNSLLFLIPIIHQWDKLKDANLFKNDFDFLSEVQKKLDNVDSLLTEIMKYFSKEFNAGVISYRIPLLVGTEKKPLFILRKCYIKEDVSKYYTTDEYFRERLVKSIDQMGGYEKLACKEVDSVIIDKAKDATYYSRISDRRISFRDDTLIIPILRDYSEKCFHPHKNKGISCNNESECSFRFTKYFGVFKLRILKDPNAQDSDEASEWLSEETKKRLSILAKQISILLNAIVEKNENNSLDVFQKELKGTSFTKIKQFDEQCSLVVKKSIHSKNCSIFRFKNDKLTFSASTDSSKNDFGDIIKGYCEYDDKLLRILFVKKEPVYFVKNENGELESIMIVPMIRKDNSKLGIMLLEGKETSSRGDLSRTFWEHDKKHIEFVIDVLTRIEESDSERLTFLSQLSHELLKPVTEMVDRNEYQISTATRNIDNYPKRILILEMKKNVDMCMMFKYIIDDVEFIYSLSKGDVQYNFEMVNLKGVITDALKFFEEDASMSKQLTFKTYLKNMPEKLWVDKSRMMQVVINLLKNAIQYSYAGEEISIIYEYNENKNCHEINFREKGMPVNQKEKESIFGLFYRSEQAVEKRPNGSGMGLYIVKQIMKAHNGDCYVKELSFPTIFTIQIPDKK